MPLPTTATLVYTCVPTNAPEGELITAMGNVVLYQSALADTVLLDVIGCQVFSDVTGDVGGNATRTIIMTLLARFFVNFPTPADWPRAFADLYTHALALGMAAKVTTVPAVFA